MIITRGYGSNLLITGGYGGGGSVLHDPDAIKFTYSERRNKAIQAGFIPRAVGISTIFKAVKR